MTSCSILRFMAIKSTIAKAFIITGDAVTMQKIKYLYRAFRYRYLLDKNELSFVVGNLKPGDTAVDVGCHKGAYTYWMRRAVGDTGQCFAFEPQGNLFNYLSTIPALFGWNNVTLENLGVSSAVGQAELSVPENRRGSSPSASLNATAFGSDGSKEPARTLINITTLDDYFGAISKKPALLKIDVEGHEFSVLQGARNLLATAKPKVLMECEQRHLGNNSMADVFSFMLELGYDGYFLEGDVRQPVSAFDPAVHQKSGDGKYWEDPGYVNNFYFV